MKLSHCEQIIDFLKRNGNQATLSQLLEDGAWRYGHKLSARLSECRKKGFKIECIKGKIPSQNIYRLIDDTRTSPNYPIPKYNWDNIGQASFI